MWIHSERRKWHRINIQSNKVDKNENEFVITLKHLATLKIPTINCEIELILTCSKNCVFADKTRANNPAAELEFQITDTTLYVLVVTLSTENDMKHLEQLKSGFIRTVKWNKYRS